MSMVMVLLILSILFFYRSKRFILYIIILIERINNLCIFFSTCMYTVYPQDFVESVV